MTAGAPLPLRSARQTLLDAIARPFALDRDEKERFLVASLRELVEHHRAHCTPYGAVLDAMFPNAARASTLPELPYVPVGLFKLVELKSVPESEVFKTLTSSGTSGQHPSRIFLDRETSILQTRALVSIAKSFLGGERLPMIIVDHPGVVHDRSAFNARGAGVVGFSTLGRDHCYLLDAEMRIDWGALDAFLARHRGERVLLFGFTFVVWQHFVRGAEEAGRRLDLGEAILVHGGGWKKLREIQVSEHEFKRALADRLGIRHVHNYYGMVEQVGSIYLECEHGALHTPSFADVVVRDPYTLEPLPTGQSGILQVLSALPRSYPGHSILTEDLGVDLGDKTCACGRRGRRVRIEGRLPEAELRGCSDVLAQSAAVLEAMQ